MTGMDEFIKIFGDVRVINLIEWALAIIFFIVVFRKLQTIIVKRAKEDDEDKEKMTKILESTERLPIIEEKIGTLEENQHAQMARIEKIEEDSRKRELTKLRERIMQSYRFQCSAAHNPLHQCTYLERVSFEEAYEMYIEMGGDGYVQEKVKPEMDSLTVIQMSDEEGLANLMHSRN